MLPEEGAYTGRVMDYEALVCMPTQAAATLSALNHSKRGQNAQKSVCSSTAERMPIHRDEFSPIASTNTTDTKSREWILSSPKIDC